MSSLVEPKSSDQGDQRVAAVPPDQSPREKYHRLEALDRSAAETLNEFCKVNTSLGDVGQSLANRALVQSIRTSLPLAISDFLTLYACLLGSTLVVEQVFALATKPLAGQTLFFTALIILPVARLAGLYPGLGLGSIMEFRQLARTLFASLLVFCGIGWFCFPNMWLFYLSVGSMSFLFGLPALATARFFVRQIVMRCRWWGMPALIVAEPKRGVELYRRMQASLEQGLRPVGVLLDPDQYWEDEQVLEQHSIPAFDIRHTDEVAWKHSVSWIVVSPCANRDVSPTLDHTLAVVPNRVLLSSTQLDLGLWDKLFCVGAATGLQLGSSRPTSVQLLVKRMVDLSLTSAAILAGLPALLTICCLVRLSSRGPMFYGQRRIGHRGKEFTAWKFRTMQMDADQVLADYLKKHPEARREWDETHKLAKDPRVTEIGRLLRATSMDELPQLWNVIRGEMSLVGPRPIVDSETYDASYIRDYPEEFETYKTVRPGLTGLWQVRCRNSGVYELRIYWDMYYIRNWCIWLDLYLIMRTLKTILLREGAY